MHKPTLRKTTTHAVYIQLVPREDKEFRIRLERPDGAPGRQEDLARPEVTQPAEQGESGDGVRVLNPTPAKAKERGQGKRPALLVSAHGASTALDAIWSGWARGYLRLDWHSRGGYMKPRLRGLGNMWIYLFLRRSRHTLQGGIKSPVGA